MGIYLFRPRGGRAGRASPGTGVGSQVLPDGSWGLAAHRARTAIRAVLVVGRLPRMWRTQQARRSLPELLLRKKPPSRYHGSWGLFCLAAFLFRSGGK